MPALTHRKTQESLLEKVIDKRKKRDAAASLRRRKVEARAENRKNRDEVSQFKKNFKVMFARFRKLTRCSFDKWNPRHAFFTYKGDKWSITYASWRMGGNSSDVDDYVTEGMHWALHHWCGGWHGDAHDIVDANEVKSGKDYSNRVITMLREDSEAPYTGRI